MKSELDIEILFNRMDKFLEEQGLENPEQAKVFRCALYVLAWVLEHECESSFAIQADKLVADFRKFKKWPGNKRPPKPKRIVADDHFAI